MKDFGEWFNDFGKEESAEDTRVMVDDGEECVEVGSLDSYTLADSSQELGTGHGDSGDGVVWVKKYELDSFGNLIDVEEPISTKTQEEGGDLLTDEICLKEKTKRKEYLLKTGLYQEHFD